MKFKPILIEAIGTCFILFGLIMWIALVFEWISKISILLEDRTIYGITKASILLCIVPITCGVVIIKGSVKKEKYLI